MMFATEYQGIFRATFPNGVILTHTNAYIKTPSAIIT